MMERARELQTGTLKVRSHGQKSPQINRGVMSEENAQNFLIIAPKNVVCHIWPSLTRANVVEYYLNIFEY